MRPLWRGFMSLNPLEIYGCECLETALKPSKTSDLNTVLSDNQVENIVLAGAVTSVCIDSTGRSAADRGYQVFVLSDCTCGRSKFEQEFYCNQVLPLYATVLTSGEFMESLKNN